MRSSASTPRCIARSTVPISSAPPWPWTIAFGMPVVPDEYTIRSGCSKATDSNFGACGSAMASRQATTRSERAGTSVASGSR